MPRLRCSKCKVKKDEEEDFYKSATKVCKECHREASAIYKDNNRVQIKATLRMMAEQLDSIHSEMVKQTKISEKLENHIEEQDEELRQIRKLLKKMSTK